MSKSLTSAQIIEIAKKKKYEKDRVISLMLTIIQHHQVVISQASLPVKLNVAAMEQCANPESGVSYHMDFDIVKHAMKIQASQMVLCETVMMLHRALIERGEKIDYEF